MGFRENFRKCRYAVYLDGDQRIMPNSRISFNFSGNWTSIDERTSWGDTENVAYSCTLSYGTYYSFGCIFSFRINVYDISHLYSSTNQRYYTRGWKSNNATQTGNRYENFSITFTRVIFSMCCTESYGARWYKDVKHASPSAKRVSQYLRWDYRASKRISCVHTQHKKHNIFIWCCVWWKFF